MQTRFKRFSIISGFAILIAVLIADAYITKRELNQQIETGLWVNHTRQVELQISEVESLLEDAETGQRGFLYTDDEQYLEPYNRALTQIDTHVNALADMTADNPRQQAAIGDLRVLVREKLDELAGTIALLRTGKQDEARKLVLSDAGLRTMNRIRAVIAGMEDEEVALASQRDAAYRKNILLTTTCIYVSATLAAAGLILLAYYILREMNLRELHAREMRAREEWFRVTLTSIGDGVIATDQKGLVTFMNPVAEELTGITTASAAGKHILQIFPIFHESTMAPVDNPVSKVIEHGRAMGLANHTVLRKPNGTLTPIDDSAAPIRDDKDELIGVVLVFRDITNDRKTERVLRNAEKLGAAARLSATVAHEINNPLEAAVPSGGTIIVTLECVEKQDRTIVHMLIEDDGPGVADEHRDRIFEPFFTTKHDVGTGLGLWVSREIIERHGGSIELTKRRDGAGGAAFAVVFDASAADAGSG